MQRVCVDTGIQVDQTALQGLNTADLMQVFDHEAIWFPLSFWELPDIGNAIWGLPSMKYNLRIIETLVVVLKTKNAGVSRC